jgi:hypothetical protein
MGGLPQIFISPVNGSTKNALAAALVLFIIANVLTLIVSRLAEE